MKKFLNYVRTLIVCFLCFLLSHQGELTSFRLQNMAIQSSYAQSDAKPDAAKLSGCSDYVDGTKRSRGDACTTAKHKYDDNEATIAEAYINQLVVWAAAISAIFYAQTCMAGGYCGWATAAISVGGLALLAGEIVSLVKFGSTVDEIEYRPDELRKNMEACESGTIAEDERVGTIGTINICDQIASLKAQKKSLEEMRSAAEIKRGLQIAAEVVFLIGAIIEAVGWFQLNSTMSTIAAAPACYATQGAILVSACGTGAAACASACAPCMTAAAAVAPIFIELETSIANLPQTTGPSYILREAWMARWTAAMTTLTTTCAAAGTCAALNTSCGFGLAAAIVERVARCVPASPCNIGALNSAMLTTENLSNKLNPYIFGSVYGRDILKLAEVFSGDIADIFEMGQPNFEPTAPIVIDYLSENRSRSIVDYRQEKLMATSINGQTVGLVSLFGNLIESAYAEGTATGKDKRKGSSSTQTNKTIAHTLGLSSTGLFILLGLVVSWKLEGDNFFMNPGNRFWWDMGLMAVVGIGIGVTSAAIGELDDNVKRLDNVLKAAALDTSNIVAAGNNAISYNEVGSMLGEQDGQKIIPDSETPLPCPAGGDGKGGCRSVGQDIGSSLQSLGLGGLAGVAGSVAKLGDQLGGSRDVSSSAFDAAGSLAKQNNAVRKKLKNVEKLINKKLLGEGKAPINIDKIKASMGKKLMKLSNDYLKSKGTTAQEVLGGAKPVVVPKEEKEKAKKEESAAVVAAIPGKAAAADPFAGMNFQNTEEGGLDLGDSEEAKAEIDGTYEVPNNDIYNDSNASIFQMISGRYLKTAYPIMFEEVSTNKQ